MKRFSRRQTHPCVLEDSEIWHGQLCGLITAGQEKFQASLRVHSWLMTSPLFSNTLPFVIFFPPFLPTIPVCFLFLPLHHFFVVFSFECRCSFLHVVFFQSAVPPGGPVGVYHRRLPPCAALGRARQQRTQGYLPYYNPLLVRPSVCSRLDKT